MFIMNSIEKNKKHLLSKNKDHLQKDPEIQ